MHAIFFTDFEKHYIPHILKEIYLDRIYHPFLEGKKDLVIADWGANIGLTSFFFKDYGTVYAVEPAKQHLECINAMVKQNNLSTVIVCPYAISNENGSAKFYHNDNVTMFSLTDRVNKKDDFEEVETVTPAEFMKRNKLDHIDLLKLDTEGFEGQIIASEGFSSVVDRIKVIVGEWHSWCSMSQDQFANCLRDYGYEFSWIKGIEAQCFTAYRI